MKKALIAFSFLLAALDRASKIYIQSRPNFYSGGIVELNLFQNTKFYFLFLGERANIIISVISAAILAVFIFLFFKYYKKRDLLFVNGLLLVILGGASNLFDRLYYSYVIDFIEIFIFPFFIFNLADVLIILGIIISIISINTFDKPGLSQL